jgi:predicted nucleotidyltransferase
MNKIAGDIRIKGLSNYVINDVLNIIMDHLDYIANYLPEIDIVWINLFGSRINGNPRDDSDLDAIIYYTGDIREDDFFNLINNDDNRLWIDGIFIDFYPININISFCF